MGNEESFKEKRIRKITNLYYSRKDVQDAIFEFCKGRESIPRYFEGFGKRPDEFQYKSDIFELVKKGATSFHCSEEKWKDSLQLSLNLSPEKMNELREGWDLLIDIDSKYIDYSKISAQAIVKMLNFYGIKNIGIKFSGSKGFHILIPWKAFPKEVNGIRTADMFPEWPRIITKFIMETTKKELITRITELTNPNRYIKNFQASEEVTPDIILVSPRHLFRAPYSLHEKTALASAVLSIEEVKKFDLSDADPLKVKVKNFVPDSKEGEASNLLIEALDWDKENTQGEDENKKEFKPIDPIKLENLSEKHFPPSIQKILKGLEDGKKRGLFILINFFRSVGIEKAELEKRIFDWNKKNPVPLNEGYIKTQLSWAYKRKPILPPNFDKDYYKGIGVVPTEEELRLKNPVSYVLRKMGNKNSKTKNQKSKTKKDKQEKKEKNQKQKSRDNFKNSR